MLALKSSMTTAVNGCTSFSKNVISCGLPLSRIVNCSCSRFGTRRPCASVTVVSTAHDPRAGPERGLSCASAGGAAARTTSAEVTNQPHSRSLSNAPCPG